MIVAASDSGLALNADLRLAMSASVAVTIQTAPGLPVESIAFSPLDDDSANRVAIARAPAFVPLREARAQVQPKHARLTSREHDLEKRMPRSRGIVPLVIVDFLATEKTDRVVSSRGPNRKLRRRGETLDYFRIGRFLKYNQVRRCCNDRFRQGLLAAMSPEADVITEQLQGHAVSPGGTTT